MKDKDKVLEFIKNQDLTVIATISNEGKPNSAVIGFAITNDFDLIFGTYSDSRKYSNLLKKSNCAFVIGWDKNITVQYEGTAEELNEIDSKTYKEILFAKNPSSRKYDLDPRQKYFKVRPKWVRYTELSKEPWYIVELNF